MINDGYGGHSLFSFWCDNFASHLVAANVNLFRINITPLQAANFSRTKTEEARKGQHKLRVNMVNQRADEVFGLFHGVMLCVFRFDGVIRHYDIVPRVHFDALFNNGTLEDRRANGTDVLQRGGTLC